VKAFGATSRADEPGEHVRAALLIGGEFDDETGRTLCELSSRGYSDLAAVRLFKRCESGGR
jgi:hypothetical protein